MKGSLHSSAAGSQHGHCAPCSPSPLWSGCLPPYSVSLLPHHLPVSFCCCLPPGPTLGLPPRPPHFRSPGQRRRTHSRRRDGAPPACDGFQEERPRVRPSAGASSFPLVGWQWRGICLCLSCRGQSSPVSSVGLNGKGDFNNKTGRCLCLSVGIMGRW